MITFLPFCFNPVGLTQGEWTDTAEVHVAFTSFPTPCPRCCPSKAELAGPHMRFATQKMKKIIVSEAVFSAIVWGLLQVWFNHLAWLYNSFRHLTAIVTVSQQYQTVFSFRAANVSGNISWDGNFWPSPCSTFSGRFSCFSNKPVKYSHMTARDISPIQWMSWTDCMENNWGNIVSGQGESNLGLQHNRLSISQLSWWTEGHPTS